jgi:hypothetical protein
LKAVQAAELAPSRRLPSNTVVAPHEITLELRQCSESGRRKGSERLGGRAPVLTTSFGDVLCASLSRHLRANWRFGRWIQQHRSGLAKDFADPPHAQAEAIGKLTLRPVDSVFQAVVETQDVRIHCAQAVERGGV